MDITVTRQCYVPASGNATCELRMMKYTSTAGLKRCETRAFQSESDTYDYQEHRISLDNGKSWGDWIREKNDTKIAVGTDEYEFGDMPGAWNPVHGHYIGVRYQRLYLGGYEAATDAYWRGEGFIDHGFLEIQDAEGKRISAQMIAYEDGLPKFQETTYRTAAYLEKNLGICHGVCVLKNGDILLDLSVPMDRACRMAGVETREVFPSFTKSANGVLICRGTWDEENKRYQLSASLPIYLDDRQSSRGLLEPVIAELKSGKILVIFRMSNLRSEEWGSRINPYAPSYKYYCISEDGGKTFSPPMPWHFDTREVVYSSSTYSYLLRSEKNGRLYWIGNITDPTKSVGNSPRYPLHIVEVDEQWGIARKETLTEIDTIRDGESEEVQLSNFNILQDRESGDLELYLSKIEQYPNRNLWDCETWKYVITLPG